MYGENSDIGKLRSDVGKIVNTDKLKHHITDVTTDQGKPRVTMRALQVTNACTVRVL